MEPTETQAIESKESIDELPRRLVRACTESMTVSPAGKGEFTVYNIRGVEYTVDLVSGSCTCPDFEKRGDSLPDGCKHTQRVEIEAGIHAIPDAIGRCDARLMIEARATRMARVDSEPTAMADGGIVEAEPEPEPEITRHVEPADQGGCVYFRCECGREAMRRQDLESEAHVEECEAHR